MRILTKMVDFLFKMTPFPCSVCFCFLTSAQSQVCVPFQSHSLDVLTTSTMFRFGGSTLPWFGLLFLFFWLPLSVVKCEFKLCSYLHTMFWLQGVIPHEGKLWLLINDTMYSLPLDRGHLDAAGGRMRIFAMHTEATNWRQISWLSAVANLVLENDTDISHLHLFGNTAQDQLWADTVIGPKKGRTDRLGFMDHYLLRLQPTLQPSESGPVRYYLGDQRPRTLYSFPHDGAGHGYVFRLGGEDDSTLKDSIVTMNAVIEEEEGFLNIPTFSTTKLPNKIRPKPGLTYYKLSIPKDEKVRLTKVPGNPTPTPPSGAQKQFKETKRYSFIFDGFIHHIDLSRRLVFIFRDPNGTESATCLRTVSQEKYFSCTETAWTAKESPLQCVDEAEVPPGQVEDDLQTYYLIGGILLAALSLLACLLAVVWCCLREKTDCTGEGKWRRRWRQWRRWRRDRAQRPPPAGRRGYGHSPSSKSLSETVPQSESTFGSNSDSRNNRDARGRGRPSPRSQGRKY